ncbi:MAG: hypothetical protein ACRDWT_03440 [Jatrophihabitantaceae bacterium]
MAGAFDLFTAMFDDAAMYPPADTKMPAAARGYARHRLSWYADTVGAFVCNARRLPMLAGQVDELALDPFDVAAVVPDGVEGLADLVRTVRGLPQLRLQAVEVPLRNESFANAARALERFRADGVLCYLEIPVLQVSDEHVHDMSAAGLRLKLRTGGTSIDAFRTEAELAAPIVLCAAERLQFKCTAGLHNAVRHKDVETKFEHHGFLNVALAARVAAATGNAEATTALLAERDPNAIADHVRELSRRDIDAIRAMFCSFGTCSIDEPISDLVGMGLVKVP